MKTFNLFIIINFILFKNFVFSREKKKKRCYKISVRQLGDRNNFDFGKIIEKTPVQTTAFINFVHFYSKERFNVTFIESNAIKSVKNYKSFASVICSKNGFDRELFYISSSIIQTSLI